MPQFFSKFVPGVIYTAAGRLRPSCRVIALFLALSGWVLAHGATAFPGNPPITPRWTYEPWVWEDDTHTTASSVGLVTNYTSRNIPVGVILLDSPWDTAYVDFQFNTAQYATPSSMIQYFRTNGVRVVCWMVGMVNNTTSGNPPPLGASPYFNFVTNSGFALKKPSDGSQVFSWWKGTGAGVDFSNTNAVNWFMGQASNDIAMGVSGFKVDMSDGFIPDPIQTTPGSVFAGANITRAQFTEYYYAAIVDWIRGQTNDGIIIARPWSFQEGTSSGSHWNGGTGVPVSHLTAGWCGDFDGTFSGFATQLSNIYNSVPYGYSALGFEVGGYNALPTHDSLLRQAEYAALMPVMENGGLSAQYHEPWYWDANGFTDTVSTYRYYATLHHNLVPFQFHCGVIASRTATTAMTQVDTTTHRHLLGNALLTFAVTSDVTPATTGVNSVTVNFPAGNLWINWWNFAQIFNGGSSNNINYNLDTAPIFVRAGSIIPVNVDNSVTGLGDTNSVGKSTVLMFPYQTNQLVYYRPLGEGIAYETNTITVAEGTTNGYVQVSAPTSQPWIFKIVSFTAPTNIKVSGIPGAYTNYTYSSVSNLLTLSVTGAVFTASIRPLAGYAAGTPPTSSVTVTSVTATPAYLNPNQSVLVAASVTVVGSTVSNVLLDASSIGAGSSVSLMLDASGDAYAGFWTNTVTVAASTPFGSANLLVTATDNAGDTPDVGSVAVIIAPPLTLQLHLPLTNNAGTATLSSSDGSINGLAFTMYNNGSTAVNLITNNASAGGLLGGASLDQTSDLTPSQGTSQPGNTTGANSGSGPVLQLLNNTALATLGNAGTVSSFMASYWLKSVANATGGNDPRIWVLSAGGSVADYTGTTSIGMQFEGQSSSLDNVMYYSIGGNTLIGTLPSGNFPVNTWMFFGVTYDGANMVMYYGTTNQTVAQIGTLALAGKTITLGSTASMNLGNSQGKTYDRAFNGWISDFRFYNGVAGSAAQNLAFLQSVQSQQLPPTPVIKLASIAARTNGLVFAGTGGVSGANYYLLSSTNLATPLTNWTRLLTNQFDNNGNFNFTNPVNTNLSKSFYILQAP